MNVRRFFGRTQRPARPLPAPWEPAPHRGVPTATAAPYLLPKDKKEMLRLDYQHFILRQVLHGNLFAPVEGMLRRGCNVLDVGCGTGRWCAEVACDFPHSLVYGFDQDEVPRSTAMPPNFQPCYRGNLLEGLPFTARSFFYTHQRLLVAGIPLNRWPQVVRELARVTMSGGWVELVEIGNGFHQIGPATRQMLHWWTAVSATRGIDSSHMSQIGTWLEEAGLIHLLTATEKLPVGSWGGRMGNVLAQDLLACCHAIQPLVQELGGIEPGHFETIVEQLEDEWNMNGSLYEVYFACGQVK